MMTPENELDLLKRAQTGDNKAFETLLREEKYSKIISYFVNKYGGAIDREGLYQEGRLGFWQAVKKFDHQRSPKEFKKFASIWIEGSIKQRLREEKKISRFNEELYNEEEKESPESYNEEKKESPWSRPLPKPCELREDSEWDEYLIFKYGYSLEDFERAFDYFVTATYNKSLSLSNKVWNLKRKLKENITEEKRNEISSEIKRINNARGTYSILSKHKKQIEIESQILALFGYVMRILRKTNKIVTDWGDVIGIIKYLQEKNNSHVIKDDVLLNDRKRIKPEGLRRLFNHPFIKNLKDCFFPVFKIEKEKLDKYLSQLPEDKTEELKKSIDNHALFKFHYILKQYIREKGIIKVGFK